jgi:uncharacterized spore protein YtfJ
MCHMTGQSSSNQSPTYRINYLSPQIIEQTKNHKNQNKKQKTNKQTNKQTNRKKTTRTYAEQKKKKKFDY